MTCLIKSSLFKCGTLRILINPCLVKTGNRECLPTVIISDYRKEFVRHRYSFSRQIQGAYFPPKVGTLKAKQSLRELPKKDVNKNEEGVKKEKASGELFRSVMGEIFASKNRKLIAFEGGKFVEEALKFGLQLRYLFVLKTLKSVPYSIKKVIQRSEEKDVPQHDDYYNSPKSGPEVHKISLKVLQDWSSVTTPPGLIGVFDKPTENVLKTTLKEKCSRSPIPLTVVLDNVREPGNLGSILRTAAGIGCKVILSQGCTDPWDMKALRAGDGAQFLVPMTRNADFINFHQLIPLEDLQCSNSSSVSLQNETDSNPEMTQTPSKAGIGIFLADSNSNDDHFKIPIVPYTSIDYSAFQAVYLCLGGETHGISAILKKAVSDLKLVYPEDVKIISRVNIPMLSPIDSLNAANALGIIGYEIARQCTHNFTDVDRK